MRRTTHEQALLAYRWLQADNDPLWANFPRLWMAFNALYNAVREDGESEAMAIKKVIRLFFDSASAQACINEIGQTRISALIALPPGDDRLDSSDANYRRATMVLAGRLRGRGAPVARLVALMGIVYQVRCNLLHGSKDPVVIRDQALVSTCTPILQIVVSRLQAIMENHHRVP